MISANNNKTNKDLIKDLVTTFIISLILFLPITGFVLDDYDVIINWKKPLSIAFVITLLRFLFFYISNNSSYLEIKSNFSNYYQTQKQAATNLIEQNLQSNTSSNLSHKIKPYQKWGIFLIACFLPFIISKYWLTVLILALIYVLLGVGLNIVVGYAGLLDLGYVGFYAVGAYTYALGAEYFQLPFWAAIPLSALLAGIFGAVLAFPVLRMHGDYLAIVTLGFGEIIRLVLNNWLSFTKGPNGVILPKLEVFGIEFTRVAQNGGVPIHELLNITFSSKYKYIFIYLVLLAIVSLITLFAYKLKNMPIGRAWEALRENEIACRSLGIYHVTTKLSAFSIGAAIGGIGGVFFATYQGFVNPSSFTFFESALILAIVVLGGMGSLTGVIISALVLTMLPEFLREFSEFRMFLFGLLMIVIMIWRPSGFVKLKRPIFNLIK